VNNDSPQKALLVVFGVALVCSILVSVASVTLRPIQERNQLIERSRNIVQLSGLVEPDQKLTDDEILEAIGQLDMRVIDIDSGEFVTHIDAVGFSSRAAVNDPELSVAIPSDLDVANIGRRPRYEVIYIAWDGDEPGRVILPIVGQGMWSTLYGYIALEDDLNTIGAATFYEQAETAGLGDQITRPDWQAKWQGRKVYGGSGEIRFRVASGVVQPGSAAESYEVDALTGASVTANAVTRLIAYWFGPHGYVAFLDQLRENPPTRVGTN
jgi:Na+-transporting NADH:ubiquinone oxidoreductase subunit C